MNTTGFVWHERLMWHDPGSASGSYTVKGDLQPGIHVENAETKRKLKNLLDAYDITGQLVPLDCEQATDEDLLRFHTREYIDRIQQLSDRGIGDAGEYSPLGRGSAEIARRAVGGTISAVQAVLRGDVLNAYSLTRPPGHHAERDRGRGFCIYNNVSLAILNAMHEGLVDRVAVVDWDVHHGNGTQQAFYNRDDVLTISLHQEMLYPSDSGFTDETGGARGEGFNINVPLPAGCGGGAYLAAMDQIVLPALEAFKPSLIIVACGYDAAYFDPLSHMMLISTHYRELTSRMMQASAQLCEGRIVICHEGGYSDFYVPLCGMAVIETISGLQSNLRDPYGGTAALPNQALKPHQQDYLDAARLGPLEKLLKRCKVEG